MLKTAEGLATTLTGGIVVTDGDGGAIYLNDKVPKGKKLRHVRLNDGRSITLYQEGRASDLWEVARETGTIHPTQKPVELPTRAIDNSTQSGDLVLDFFGGSGSTLIAAELTGRRCYTVELDPHFCDAIIRRYMTVTGRDDVTGTRAGQPVDFELPDTEEGGGDDVLN